MLTWSPSELTYLAVDAKYARRGAGTMMVQWALDKCEAEQVPAFVSSTVDSVPFYEKLGFKIAGRMSIDLSKVSEAEGAEMYEEVGCIYTPAS